MEMGGEIFCPARHAQKMLHERLVWMGKNLFHWSIRMSFMTAMTQAVQAVTCQAGDGNICGEGGKTLWRWGGLGLGVFSVRGG
jgi:hypothetical protein